MQSIKRYITLSMSVVWGPGFAYILGTKCFHKDIKTYCNLNVGTSQKFHIHTKYYLNRYLKNAKWFHSFQEMLIMK